jgi:hypothetical protein
MPGLERSTLFRPERAAQQGNRATGPARDEAGGARRVGGAAGAPARRRGRGPQPLWRSTWAPRRGARQCGVGAPAAPWPGRRAFRGERPRGPGFGGRGRGGSGKCSAMGVMVSAQGAERARGAPPPVRRRRRARVLRERAGGSMGGRPGRGAARHSAALQAGGCKGRRREGSAWCERSGGGGVRKQRAAALRRGALGCGERPPGARHRDDLNAGGAPAPGPPRRAARGQGWRAGAPGRRRGRGGAVVGRRRTRLEVIGQGLRGSQGPGVGASQRAAPPGGAGAGAGAQARGVQPARAFPREVGGASAPGAARSHGRADREAAGAGLGALADGRAALPARRQRRRRGPHERRRGLGRGRLVGRAAARRGAGRRGVGQAGWGGHDGDVGGAERAARGGGLRSAAEGAGAGRARQPLWRGPGGQARGRSRASAIVAGPRWAGEGPVARARGAGGRARAGRAAQGEATRGRTRGPGRGGAAGRPGRRARARARARARQPPQACSATGAAIAPRAAGAHLAGLGALAHAELALGRRVLHAGSLRGGGGRPGRAGWAGGGRYLAGPGFAGVPPCAAGPGRPGRRERVRCARTARRGAIGPARAPGRRRAHGRSAPWPRARVARGLSRWAGRREFLAPSRGVLGGRGGAVGSALALGGGLRGAAATQRKACEGSVQR